MHSLLSLITAVHAAKYYCSIDCALNDQALNYNNVLATFEMEHKAYENLKEEGSDMKIPLVLDKDGDHKVINWIPPFHDYCSTLFGAYGPLSFVLCDVPDVADDPLLLGLSLW